MKYILYSSHTDHGPHVGEVPEGRTGEQVCLELNGTWIGEYERRYYLTPEDAEKALLVWAVSSGGFIGAGDPTPVT